LDDDCDGQIDEDLIPPSADLNQGICGGQKKECSGAAGWTEPDYASLPEYVTFEDTMWCDGLDNDCDGESDEGCDCVDDAKKGCGSSNVGACKFGEMTCEEGKWGPCVGAVEAVAEECNGIDDDCDGQKDEDLEPPASFKQEGVCSGSRQECKDTDGWKEPDYTKIAGYQEVESLCDGLDNDCSGQKDVGCECIDGDKRACGKSAGICKPGTQTCLGGKWQMCEGSVEPEAEICDGLDNDCNGQPDEGCNCINDTTRECGFKNVGRCKMGAELCVDGEWGTCIGAVMPSAEVCNGADDDCDGAVDEDIADAPIMDVSGVCAEGGVVFTKVCTGGAWQDRDLSVMDIDGYEKVEQSCDGKDNDCDGQVDEGCECAFGSQRACTTRSDWCDPGIQRCVDGKWADCEGGTPKKTEVCNGEDDDCNGIVDDIPADLLPLADNQQGACSGTRKKCVDGKLVEPAHQSVESSCDNADNDCDGVVDEGITKPCSSQCGTGVQTCSAGVFGACSAPLPIAEICNGADDDCNGKIDDGLTAPLASKTQGVCKGQVQVCNGKDGWGEPIYTSIAGYTLTETGMCDGIDNDCDGTTDEGCSCIDDNVKSKVVKVPDGGTRPCGTSDIGRCKLGTQTCTTGSWSACVGSVGPAAETCNGQDDDCDGVKDNNISPDMMPLADKQAGVCEGMVKRCVKGLPVEPIYTSNRFYQAKETACDNMDNNCDGYVDRGLKRSCSTPCGSGTETCKTGVWGNCTAPQPSQEVCDNIDNNCDGVVDHIPADCTNGCGTGVCIGGQVTQCNCTVGPGTPDVTVPVGPGTVNGN
jgi:hypothetical protein